MVANERLQLLILFSISLGFVTLTAAAYYSERLLYHNFLGSINPLLASIVIALLGGILLIYFLSRGWFAIYSSGNPIRFVLLSGLAALMALIMILVDLRVILPEDLNVPFPHSLLYYPSIAYAVEILFHVTPLFVLLIIPTSLSKSITFETIIWPCIFIVSLAEPIFQIQSLFGKYPFWAIAFIALHLWVFNMIQLVLFKRYDFISMYSFRLVYYFIWHIVWGHYRLRLLF